MGLSRAGPWEESVQSAVDGPARSQPPPWRVWTLFGTRPEIIKLAPVIRALEAAGRPFRTMNVATGQHRDMVRPFADALGVRIDRDLATGRAEQSPLDICRDVLAAVDSLLRVDAPDVLLVQGDTTSAMAGALAAFHHRVPVGHVEAGLRSGDVHDPFPEEMNRRLITRLARWHFAATARNARTLRGEGVPDRSIVVTGNPIVDAVHTALAREDAACSVAPLLEGIPEGRWIVLTTHRRESFGTAMTERLRAVRRFVERHGDMHLIFPVHPNPAVADAVHGSLSGAKRVHLFPPLGYFEFVHLLSRAWLVISDSGGVQEEAPSVGRPLLVIRTTTERPEVIEAGCALLVGSVSDLEQALERFATDPDRYSRAASAANPFGEGDAGIRIADALESFLVEADADGPSR